MDSKVNGAEDGPLRQHALTNAPSKAFLAQGWTLHVVSEAESQVAYELSDFAAD